MKRYILQRLAQLVIVMFAVSLISFALIRQIPGVKIEIVIAGPGANEQQVQEVKELWRLDEPIPVQYGIWVKNMLTGDLGRSSAFSVSAASLITDRLPNSIRLMVYAQFLSLALAMPLGMIAAYRVNSRLDRAISITSFGFLSFPPVVAGPFLVWLLAVKAGWLPAIYSDVGFFSDPWQHFKVWLLPTLVLSFSIVAGYLRLLRSDMAATLQSDFITMARAKGLTPRRIMWRHALRASSITLLTVAGLSVGTMIGSALVVEVIFGIPGLGTLTAEAIIGLQYGALQTYVAAMAILFVVVNIGVDILYGVVDPRIRNV